MTREHIFQCECGGPHYLKVSFDGEAGFEQWVTIESFSTAPDLYWRLREAWKLLRHNTHEAQWLEMHLDVAKSKALAAVLVEAVEIAENWKGPVPGMRIPDSGKGRLFWRLRMLWWDLGPVFWLLLGAVGTFLWLR